MQRCAAILQSGLRLPDIIARWGGEEFIVLLPDITLVKAVSLAERLRELIANDAILHELTETGVTISVGVSPFDVTKTMDWHINLADKQLYKAKRNGRNCVIY